MAVFSQSLLEIPKPRLRVMVRAVVGISHTLSKEDRMKTWRKGRVWGSDLRIWTGKPGSYVIIRL